MLGSATYNNLTGKELYDLDTARIKQAEPTESQLARGKRIFWWVVAVSICLMVHMLFQMTIQAFYWMAIYSMILGVSPHIMYKFSGVLCMAFLDYRINFKEANLYRKYIFFPVFLWNLYKHGNTFRALVLVLFIFMFVVLVLSATIFEIIGCYVDISPYISILDKFETIWDYSGGDMSMPVYRFASTMSIFLYYSVYILSFLFFVITTYDVYLGRTRIRKMVCDPACRDIIRYYVEIKPEKFTRSFYWKMVRALVLLVLIVVGFFWMDFVIVFDEGIIVPFLIGYEFSYANGAYSILHSCFFVVVYLAMMLVMSYILKLCLEYRNISQIIKEIENER